MLETIKKSMLLSWLIGNLYGIYLGVLGFLYRFRYFGRCKISPSTRVIGWRHISFGDNVVICHGSWINVSNRDKSKVYKITISDKTFLGANNFLSVGKRIHIGSHVLTASNCSFIGATHVVDDVYRPYFSTGVTENNTIQVGDNCFFGYGSSVIGDVTIGRGSIIGAHAVVLNDIPPFSMVVGNPAKVIKRFDFKKNQWTKYLSDVDESLFPSEKEYKVQLDRQVYNPLLASILANRLLSSIY